MYNCRSALHYALVVLRVGCYYAIESGRMPVRIAELLQTKLQRPGVTRDLVPRPRLIQQLNQAIAGPLTLVCAPAGFGKSTLLSSWIEGMSTGASGATPSLPAAWLSLDEGDSDLALFLRYFVAALRTIMPEACAGSAAMLVGPRQPPMDVVVATLSNEIALLSKRFVLVLDDYYAIEGHTVHDFLNALVLHWPQPMHLVVISRLNPPLPLASLRAKGLITEIHSRELRFTRAETAEYLNRVLPAPPSEPAVALLEQRTEGWIAGLHLASLSLRSLPDPETLLESLSGAEVDIAGYLVDEVLSRQPPAIQRFLLRTSILDRFCASLAEAVAGSHDPSATREPAWTGWSAPTCSSSRWITAPSGIAITTCSGICYNSDYWPWQAGRSWTGCIARRQRGLRNGVSSMKPWATPWLPPTSTWLPG